MRLLVSGGFAVAWLAMAEARPAQADPSPCGTVASSAERDAGLPAGLLGAIGVVETGRFDHATGRTEPWPWSTNMGGVGHFFATKAEAVAWTAAQIAAGQASIDVGCFQINLKYHPAAFANLEDAFDPLANARYAAVFLTGLYRKLGQWTVAAQYYHSADPAQGEPYGRRVMALMGGLTETAPASGAQAHAVPRSFPAQLARFAMQVIIPNWAQQPAATPANATVRPAAYVSSIGTGRGRRPSLRLPIVYRP